MQLVPESVMPHVRRFGFSGVIAVSVVVVMLLGINPVTVLTGKVSPPPPPTSITGVPPEGAAPNAVAAYPRVVAGEAELMWKRAFKLTAIYYPPIRMEVVDDSSGFGCGAAGKALATFYCADNQTIYVDTSAYQRLRQSHPGGADYAQALLVAEAYGHHTQYALDVFERLAALRSQGDEEGAVVLERRIDMQAACYGAMWTITVGIDALLDDPEVVAALDAVEAGRSRAILNVPAGRVIPETLAAASFEGRKHWYDKGYAIPAGGSCSLSRIEAAGLS